MNEALLHRLNELGLTTYEAAVYLALLERADYTPADLAQRAAVPRQRIYDVLSSLEEKGFCLTKSTRPRMYSGVDPAIALEHYRSAKERQLSEESARIRSLAATAAEELSSIYRSGLVKNDPFRYLEVLRTAGTIAQRAVDIAKETTTCVNSFVKLPLILTGEQNNRFIHEPLKRGILYQSVYEESFLESEGGYDFARACYDLGQQVRVSAHLPVKMQVFDDRVALLSLQDPVGGIPSFTALLLHHVGMVETLNITFESIWNQAEPFRV